LKDLQNMKNKRVNHIEKVVITARKKRRDLYKILQLATKYVMYNHFSDFLLEK
jgi:hypothetical protein